MLHHLASDLINHYIGLLRKVADDIAAGNGRCKVGKDPLSFSLYKKICDICNAECYIERRHLRSCFFDSDLELNVKSFKHSDSLSVSHGVLRGCFMYLLAKNEKRSAWAVTERSKTYLR